MTNDKLLQTVFTGEIFQPVRIYYHVFDKKAVLRVFAKLRCMTFDRPRDRWVWLYEKEAKKLKFKHAYSAIPKKMHPIVLGSFFFREADKMIVDLRSFERATKALVFFDKKIRRSAAKVTDMAVVNWLFDVSEGSQPKLDVFFDSNKMIEKDPNAIFEEVVSQKESAIGLCKILWLILVKGADSEETIYEALHRVVKNHDSTISLGALYYHKMKNSLTKQEIKKLKKHYADDDNFKTLKNWADMKVSP